MSKCPPTLLALSALFAIPSIAAPSDAQAPSLDDVLERVAAYVADFVPRFANVVAVET